MLSITLLTFLIIKVGPDELIQRLRTIDWRWYLPALTLFFVNIVLRAFRWSLLVRSFDKKPTFRHLIYLYLVGFFANNFIPSSFGADVVKAASLRQSSGQGARAVGSVMMDRAIGLLGTSSMALLALSWNGLVADEPLLLPRPLWVVTALLALSIPAGFILLRLGNPLRGLGRFIPKVNELPKFNKLIELADIFGQYPAFYLMLALLVSIPFTINLVIIQYSIARSLGVILPISLFFLFAPFISLVNLLPISFNGLGVRETLYPFLFVPLGVADETAVAMAFAFSLLRLTAGLLGGVCLMLGSVMTMVQQPHVEKM